MPDERKICPTNVNGKAERGAGRGLRKREWGLEDVEAGGYRVFVTFAERNLITK